MNWCPEVPALDDRLIAESIKQRCYNPPKNGILSG